MNALTPTSPAAELHPGQFAPDDAVAAAASHRRQRHDGWTPDRQRIFLESIADGHAVEAACRFAGMSPSAAYAFRRRAAGAAFDLGWRAASLLARDQVADALLTRALDGQRETITRANGDVIERHRFDNRLAATMLARLDRMAEATDPRSAAANASARLVAREFDGYLDLIERDAGPARAGLFVATRDPVFGNVSLDADIAPVLSLARADRYLRTRAGAAAEVDTSDLAPEARATWTAEQWVRAEAAGLLVLAPPAPEPRAEAPEPAPAEPEDEPECSSPLSPLRPRDQSDRAAEIARLRLADDAPPVWYDEDDKEWRTSFPPPAGFDGYEDGEFGDRYYARELTDPELAIVQRVSRDEDLAFHDEQQRLRDDWFAAQAEFAQGEGDDTPG